MALAWWVVHDGDCMTYGGYRRRNGRGEEGGDTKETLMQCSRPSDKIFGQLVGTSP